jgi:hypothetical protein
MTALLGTSLYEYFENHQDQNYLIPPFVDALVPFSFRQPVKKLKNVKPKNDFAAIGVQISI